MTKSACLVFCLLLLGISQISAMTKEERELLIKAVHDNCVELTGVEEQMIADCSNGIFAEDERLKCYMKCLLISGFIMDEATGELNLKHLTAMIPEEMKADAVPIINECGTVRGANNCETAFLTNKCWHSKAPEVRFRMCLRLPQPHRSILTQGEESCVPGDLRAITD